MRNHLSLLLAALGFPSAWIDAEIQEMADVLIAKTNSRSILATMNDFTYAMGNYLWSEGFVDFLAVSLFLSDILVGPLHYQKPQEVSYNLMKQRYASR